MRPLPVAAPILLIPFLVGTATAQKGGEGVQSAPAGCDVNPRCAEVTSFVATVTDFTRSATNNDRLVSITVRFKNKTDAPLVLGYVRGSGLAVDDRGNRFQIYDGGVRGLGEVGPGLIDPKFTLTPHETGDARLEFSFRPNGAIVGSTFTIDLAIREIESLPGGQWQLGPEHALEFRGLGDLVANPQPSGDPPGAVKPMAEAAPPTVSDGCAGKRFCYGSSSFTAELTRITPSQSGRFRDVQLTVRFRNLTTRSLVLAETANSALVVDDEGNRYSPATPEVSGLGQNRYGTIDASFVLRPGESRDASFSVRDAPTGRVGSTYSFDFSVDEVEILPGNPPRVAREHAVGFHDVATSGPNALHRPLIDIHFGRP